MTEDLIARLRDKARSGQTYGGVTLCEAADALEAKDRRIAELEALVKELADELQVYICAKYVGRKGCPKSKRDEYDAAAEPVRKARNAISVNRQVKFDSSPDSKDPHAALEKKND